MLSRIFSPIRHELKRTRFPKHSTNVVSTTARQQPLPRIQPHRTAAHAHCTNYSMDKAYLRNEADSQELHISFRYANEELRVDRDFNFCRDMNEKVEAALTRIRVNFEKELNKRAKKGKKKITPAQVQEPALPGLLASEIPVEFVRTQCKAKVEDVTFAEMLGTLAADMPSDLQLRVLDRTFEVVVNQPWVVNLVLPTSMLAGFTVYPCKVEMKFADREHSRGTWFKVKAKHFQPCASLQPPSANLQNNVNWIHCGNGFSYNSSNHDVGYHLKFVLTPGNASGQWGPPVEHITKNGVQAGPGTCPFETRHCFTQQRLKDKDQLRVVSYNILADLYADSDYSRTQLFPYCPPYALKMDYRKQLFVKEILGYNADIVCLQEVDLKIFDLDLKPVLEAPEQDFRGVLAQKGSCGEGVATFYRNDRYEFLSTHVLNIGENIRTLPEFAKLWEKIRNNEKLVDRICDRATTLQVTLLKCRATERLLLVANTHLYFHPDADHIRLLQIGFALLYVEHIYKLTQSERQLSQNQQLAVIFCGDFNSVPECGIYKLMTERYVGKDFIDWSSNEKEAVKNVTLSQPFKMQSACGTPSYTNYTHLFAACLDYIFYQSDCLEVQQVIPLPTDDELKAHTAIPSVVFPSDHVALVADLKFKPI